MGGTADAGALGLAVFSAIATSHTHHLMVGHTPTPEALTSGFHRALLACALCLAAASVIALRTINTHGEPPNSTIPQPVGVPDAA